MKPIKMLERPHHAEMDDRFHQLEYGNVGNVVYWWEFLKMLRGVPGDIVECGVGRGRSLLIVAVLNDLLTAAEGGERNIYGYDSFEGFPEPTSEDRSPRHPKKGEWSRSPSGKYEYSPTFITDVMGEAGVPLDRITLTPGYFDQTLSAHPDRPIALLHVDGDLYQSYKTTLEVLYPKVVSGGIVELDDFFIDDDPVEGFPGSRQATKEFFGAEYANLRRSIGGTFYYII